MTKPIGRRSRRTTIAIPSCSCGTVSSGVVFWNFSNGISGYEIYRLAEDNSYNLIGTNPPSQTEYHDDLSRISGESYHGIIRYFVKAIETGKSEWTPAIVNQDNQCEFGKWLYACSPQERSSSHYNKIKALHADFHKAAADVLTMALNGKKAEAEANISATSKYRSISAALTKEMMSWKSEAS